MRRFLRDIIWVIIFGLICATIVEVLLSHLQSNSYSYKRQYVETHKDDISVLLLGHSQFYYGVNPWLLGDSVFNMAESARWIYYDAKFAEEYIPKMKNLKVVLFPIGYSMPEGYHSYHYEQDMQDSEDNHDYHIHMYAKYMHIPYDRWPQNITSFSSFLSGTFAFKELTKELECDSLGYKSLYPMIHYPDWDTANLPCMPDNLMNDTTHSSIYVQEFITYLTDIARVCKDNNVRFITVSTPCHQNYLDKTCENGINTMLYVVEKVAEQYPIEYHNYMADEEFRADSIYLDCSHLNYLGAEQFSLRLKKDFGL